MPEPPSVKTYGPPPRGIPGTFVNYTEKRRALSAAIDNKNLRLICVVGQAGTGKSRLSGCVLHSLEDQVWQHEAPQSTLSGILYLDASDNNTVTLDTIFNGVMEIVDENTRTKLEKLPYESHERARQMLDALKGVIIFIDAADCLLARGADTFFTPGIGAFFQACRDTSKAVHVVVTSKVRFRFEDNTGVCFINMNPSPDDEILSDTDAIKLLTQICSHRLMTEIPIEALRSLMVRVNYHPGLIAELGRQSNVAIEKGAADAQALLQSLNNTLNQGLNTGLIKQTYEQCSPEAKHIMYALAVYNRPVPAAAVQAIFPGPGVDVQAGLNELERFYAFDHPDADASRRQGLFRLTQVDQEYAYNEFKAEDAVRFRQWHEHAAEYYQGLVSEDAELETIQDLDPLMRAIGHFILAENYKAALDQLYEIDLQLLGWGNYETVYSFYKQLEHHLNGFQKTAVLLMLGRTSHILGRSQEAISYFESAIPMARAHVEDAALLETITKPQLDRRVSALLNGVAIAYGEIGQFRNALAAFDASLGFETTANLPDSPDQIIIIYGNMAQELVRLGNFTEAEKQFEKAFSDPEFKVPEALGTYALLLILQGKFDAAVEQARAGFEAAEDDHGGQSHCAYFLALAYLCLNQLEAADDALQPLREFVEPANNHNILALTGVVAMRRNQPARAQAAFFSVMMILKKARSDRPADMLLFDLVFADALAQAGLVLCQPSAPVSAAVEAHTQAIEYITEGQDKPGAKGVIQLAHLLIKELSKHNPAPLDPVRSLLEAEL